MKPTLIGSIAAVGLLAGAAQAQGMAEMPGMTPAPAAPASPTASRSTGAMPGMAAPDHAEPAPRAMGDMDMDAMTGVLGAYPITREASGTSWRPDTSQHDGIHVMRGAWTYMAHATLNGAYDDQHGPRGGRAGFVSGMVMLAARRDFANADSLNLRAMLSPEPALGPRGYPLLLAAGETANGTTPLIDRQHPHDLFMEMSASYGHRLSAKDSVFLYAGLPGEPAFGPPAFMHRASIMDSPEAPISHHWLDSTHITFGVVTAGWVHGDWKLEASRYRGREPDQHRWNIEPPRLDSTAIRLSWNPTARLALQASWADQHSPEQLSPPENERRWSGSAIYTRPVGVAGWWSTTAAWGQRQSTGGPALDAEILESAVHLNEPWTIFARAERTATDELKPGLLHGPAQTVAKVSVGAVHDWRIAPHLNLGLGGLYAANLVPGALAASYGGDMPTGGMVFVRLKLY